MRAVVADDEVLARERVRDLLADFPDVEVVAETASGRETIEAIRRLHPALLFLDVQMPDLDGFDVLRELAPEERPDGIVFVTAYDRYAVDAFEVNAVDYLLKPYTRERFAVTLERARSRLKGASGVDSQIESLLQTITRTRTAPERLAIRSKDGVQFVPVDEIDWAEAEGNYTRVYVGKNYARVRENISDLEARLKDNGFMRVHRSVIVNVDRILRIEPWAHGEYVIVLRNGTKINSSRTYGSQLRALFR